MKHFERISRFLGCTALLLAATLAHGMDDPEATGIWEKHKIPGASCGDGDDYAIFLRRGDPRKIVFHLMGGGACWSTTTCVGPKPMTWIHPIPKPIEIGGLSNIDPAKSPVHDFTYVHFPYCTGDLHMGKHIARYGVGKEIHHVGRLNIEQSFRYVREELGIRLETANEMVVYGYSAGALGALFHVSAIDAALNPQARKALILDSPGLHFGPDVWQKFSPKQLEEFAEALEKYGLSMKPGDGNMARVVPTACSLLPDWSVSVLQGSQDIVMSSIFGEISPEEHERMIYGPGGLYEITQDPSDRCSAWVPQTKMHMFLVSESSAAIEASGKTAMDFVRDALNGSSGRNYR